MQKPCDMVYKDVITDFIYYGVLYFLLNHLPIVTDLKVLSFNDMHVEFLFKLSCCIGLEINSELVKTNEIILQIKLNQLLQLWNTEG